jgi:hypothetical protein
LRHRWECKQAEYHDQHWPLHRASAFLACSAFSS